MTYLNLKTSNFFVLVILLILYSCSSQNVLTITTNNQTININVELAKTSAEHERGLMFREILSKNSGMFFVFSDEQERTFWMKNTLIRLDIIFISADKKIVDIKKNFQPCTTTICETFTSKPAKYALEVNAGFVDENKIEIGDAVKL